MTQVGLPEEEHLVAHELGAHRLDRSQVQRLPQIQAVDLGAEGGRQRHHGEALLAYLPLELHWRAGV